jgi:hypothetical protein
MSECDSCRMMCRLTSTRCHFFGDHLASPVGLKVSTTSLGAAAAPNPIVVTNPPAIPSCGRGSLLHGRRMPLRFDGDTDPGRGGDLLACWILIMSI